MEEFWKNTPKPKEREERRYFLPHRADRLIRSIMKVCPERQSGCRVLNERQSLRSNRTAAFTGNNRIAVEVGLDLISSVICAPEIPIALGSIPPRRSPLPMTNSWLAFGASKTPFQSPAVV